jgi:hypothetical protein
MKEYKEGRYKSPKQAIAVAYSQVRKSHPHCVFKKPKSTNKSVKKSLRRTRRK